MRKRTERLLGTKGSVLNIGVGSGRLEELLQEAGHRVSALDPDPKAIDRLSAAGIDSHTGKINALPFEDGFFDMVIASEVLEHLEESEAVEGVHEICRVLAPGGRFIGTVPYNETLSDNLTVCPCCGETFHRWGHRQSFRHENLTGLLDTCLELTHLSKRSFITWSPRPSRLLKSSFRWILGRLGEQVASPHLYFESRKR